MDRSGRYLVSRALRTSRLLFMLQQPLCAGLVLAALEFFRLKLRRAPVLHFGDNLTVRNNRLGIVSVKYQAQFAEFTKLRDKREEVRKDARTLIVSGAPFVRFGDSLVPSQAPALSDSTDVGGEEGRGSGGSGPEADMDRRSDEEDAQFIINLAEMAINIPLDDDDFVLEPPCPKRMKVLG